MQSIEQHPQSNEADITTALPAGTASIHSQPVLGYSAACRDWLGVTASIACAIHCAAMPFAVGFLPVLELSFFADPAFHKWMVAICLGLAVFAFVPGWRRHRRLSPAFMAVGGLSLIAVAAYAGEDTCCPASGTADKACTVCVAPDEMVAKPAGTESTDAKTMDTNSTSECTETTCSGCNGKAQASETTEPPTTAEASVATVPVVTHEPLATTETAQPSVLSTAWPWVTPLGGVLLVLAHLQNRYWGYRCGCAVDCDGGRPLPTGREISKVRLVV